MILNVSTLDGEIDIKCLKCEFVHYCDKSCQEQAWNLYHKDECSYLIRKEELTNKVRALYSGRMLENVLGQNNASIFMARIILKG